MTRSLNFDAHIKFFKNEQARSLGILFKTRQYLNTSTLVQLCYSTFHAYLSSAVFFFFYFNFFLLFQAT